MLFVAEYDGDILLCQFADERRGERCRMIVDKDFCTESWTGLSNTRVCLGMFLLLLCVFVY